MIGGTPCIETLRAAEAASHVRTPAERTIELIQPGLAQPACHATARQSHDIADGAQAQTGELFEHLFGPTETTERNQRQMTC
jgi:hypothetical protein